MYILPHTKNYFLFTKHKKVNLEISDPNQIFEAFSSCSTKYNPGNNVRGNQSTTLNGGKRKVNTGQGTLGLEEQHEDRASYVLPLSPKRDLSLVFANFQLSNRRRPRQIHSSSRMNVSPTDNTMVKARQGKGNLSEALQRISSQRKCSPSHQN